MRLLKTILAVIFLTVSNSILFASDSLYSELWVLDNIENIGGYTVSVLGDPQIIKTDLGNAVEFDGNADQLVVDSNPINTSKEFTVELIFMPYACYPDNTEPRFVHIQDPNDPEEKRVMMELRVNKNNECYLDGFIKTDFENLTLIDEALVHTTEVWHHAAITYSDSIFTTYFDGVKELSGIIKYTDEIVNPEGKTSLGARMNNRSYYKGLMKAFKVTHAVLDPNDFISPEDFIENVSVIFSTNSFFNRIEAFPNPADEKLCLRFADNIVENASIKLKLINIKGDVVYSKAYSPAETANQLHINTSNFNEGVYYLQVQSNNLTNSRLMLIKH